MASTRHLSPDASRAHPKTLFGYDVTDFIGRGAGSALYAATDPQSGRTYALKHVVRSEESDIRFIDQLENEYAVTQNFAHASLRKSYSLKLNRSLLRRVTEGCLVMELFDGFPMEAHLPHKMSDVLSCFIQTARALLIMHEAGFVHCDLKPANILINGDIQVKLIDFGQTCKSGTVKKRVQGTPDFIAPEQVRCEPVSVRTDVFNFGATLYWAMCGTKLPTLYTLRRAENSFLLDQTIPSPRNLNPQVPEPLSKLIMDCVRSVPTKRPDLREIAGRLEVMRHGIAQSEPGTRAKNKSSSTSHARV